MKIETKILARRRGRRSAVTMAACGGGDETASGGDPAGERWPDHHRHQVRPARPRPASSAATTRASTSRSRATSPRISATPSITFKEAPPPSGRPCSQTGQVKMIVRHLLDQRRPQAEGHLRRPVLRRRPGPAGPGGQHRHHGPGLAERQEAVLGDRLHVGEEGPGRSSPAASQLQQYDTYSKCVEALAGRQRDRRGHHRQRHPGRLRGAGAVRGQAEGGRQDLLRPRTTASGSRRTTSRSARRSTARIEKMIADGSWQKALDDTVGASGFEPDAATNPPKPAPCA